MSKFNIMALALLIFVMLTGLSNADVIMRARKSIYCAAQGRKWFNFSISFLISVFVLVILAFPAVAEVYTCDYNFSSGYEDTRAPASFGNISVGWYQSSYNEVFNWQGNRIYSPEYTWVFDHRSYFINMPVSWIGSNISLKTRYKYYDSSTYYDLNTFSFTPVVNASTINSISGYCDFYGRWGSHTNDFGEAVIFHITNYTTSSALVADFTCNPQSGITPLNVQFQDMSIGSPTSWSWNFGDDNTSSDQNPSHTYYTPGTYTVTLNASNSYGYSLANQTILITVASAPIANFTAIPTLSVHFTDTSTGNPTSWDWDLGDGNATYNTPTNDFTHTYYTPGTYTVRMTARNAAGSSISSKIASFSVTSMLNILNATYTTNGYSDGWPATNEALMRNQKRNVNITMQNTGQGWSDTSNIYLKANNSDAIAFGPEKIPISSTVNNLDKYTFNFDIKVPDGLEGKYKLKYRMYCEGYGYFGDEVQKEVYVGTIVQDDNDGNISSRTVLDHFHDMGQLTPDYYDDGFLSSYVNCSGATYWEPGEGSSNGGWAFSFVQTSTGSVWQDTNNTTDWPGNDGNAWLAKVINSHFIKVNSTYNQDEQFIISGDSAYCTAANPGTGGTSASGLETFNPIFKDYVIAKSIEKLVEAGIEISPEVLAAFYAINLMVNVAEEQNIDGDQLAVREWDYGNTISNYSNYWYWEHLIQPGAYVQFVVISGFKLSPTANGHFGSPDTPDPGAMSNEHLITITAPLAPDTLSQSQLAQYGIQKVSMAEVQANPKAYGISDKSLKKLKDRGQKDVYYIPANKLKKLLKFQEVK